MSMLPNLDQLEQLFSSGELLKAEELCKSALKQGLDRRMWKTRLGYVLFQNEQEPEKHYTEAFLTFEELTKEYPQDANAHFWLGYIYYIRYHNDIEFKKELDRVL